MRVLGSAIEGELVRINGQPFDVGAKCGTNQGQWFCLVHDLGFVNNIQKDGHISQGTHVLAWLCFTHGPEVP